jgi:maltose phosphorylase
MAKVATRYLDTDPWIIEEKGFHPKHSRVSESIFSVANEYMGVRGYFEEGYSGETMQGSYFNGIFEWLSGDKGESPPFGSFRGTLKNEHTLVNAVDWLYTRIRMPKA